MTSGLLKRIRGRGSRRNAGELNGAMLRTIGRGSLSEALRAVLWIARFVCLLLVALMGVLAATAIFAYATGGASMPGVLIEVLSPAHLVLPGILIAAGGFFVAYFIVDRLTRIFATLAAGDPFVHENAEHLRAIWVAMVAFELARYAVAAGMALLRQIVLETGDAASAGEIKADVWLVEPVIWFAILVIAVLAEVFREGARLRDEQKLTI